MADYISYDNNPDFQFFQELNGHKIYVDLAGNFHARVNGRDTKRANLSALKKLLAEHARPLKVMVVSNQISSPQYKEVVAASKVKRHYSDNVEFRTAEGQTIEGESSAGGNFYGVVVATVNEELFSQLEDCVKELRSVQTRWRELIGKLKPLTVAEFDALRAEIEESPISKEEVV